MEAGGSWTGQHRSLLQGASVAVPMAVIAFILIGYSYSITVTISASIDSNPALDDSVYVADFPSNVNVSVHWWMAPANQTWHFNNQTYFVNGTNFVVFDPDSDQVCNEVGSGGICYFVSIGGNYTFRAESLAIVNFTATYYVSLL